MAGKRAVPTLAGPRVRLRPLAETDLELVRAWRNQASIRRWFKTSAVIEPDQQRRWHARYRELDTDFVFVIEVGARPVGMVSLYGIDWPARTAEFGRLLIGEPEAAGRGLAHEATERLLAFAFDTFRLDEVRLEVFADNARALAIYARCGFATTDTEGGLVRMVKRRGPRVLAVSPLQDPSAVLGVNAVFADLAEHTRCQLRIAETLGLRPADLAWADVVVLVRPASSLDHGVLRWIQGQGRRVAAFYDDDLQQVPAGAGTAGLYGSTWVQRHLAAIQRGADMVLVCSDRLRAELERRHGRAVTLLRPPRPAPAAGGGGPIRPAPGGPPSWPVRVGFFGGLDHRAFVGELLREPLTKLVFELGPRVQLVFCGAVPDFARELGSECHPFEPDYARWRQRAGELDLAVGLAPLPDTPFHRCKYFNKYTEYATLGVAAVYSDSPPYADVVEDGVTGLLCPNDPGAWHRAVRSLVLDAEGRRRMAGAARADVEARFSPAVLRPAWLDALAPLLAHRAPDREAAMIPSPPGLLRFAADRLRTYGPWGFASRALRKLPRTVAARRP